MGFRVFDLEKRKWLEKNLYLDSNGELFLVKPYIFGLAKAPFHLSDDRYIYHRDIELWDKDGKLIFEGDWLEAEVNVDKTLKGIVAYASELSAYVLLCDETNEFYTLGKDAIEHVKVIGNVFDGYEK